MVPSVLVLAAVTGRIWNWRIALFLGDDCYRMCPLSLEVKKKMTLPILIFVTPEDSCRYDQIRSPPSVRIPKMTQHKIQCVQDLGLSLFLPGMLRIF